VDKRQYSGSCRMGLVRSAQPQSGPDSADRQVPRLRTASAPSPAAPSRGKEDPDRSPLRCSRGPMRQANPWLGRAQTIVARPLSAQRCLAEPPVVRQHESHRDGCDPMSVDWPTKIASGFRRCDPGLRHVRHSPLTPAASADAPASEPFVIPGRRVASPPGTLIGPEWVSLTLSPSGVRGTLPASPR
jgi:hypothetical protein